MLRGLLPITAAVDEPLAQPSPALPGPGADQAPLHPAQAVAEGDLLSALDLDLMLINHY